ncbi:TnpV protein [Ruthenibacterium lactatiformans]|uniref:TnpV protein n=1 Tax=Ruthenibacterium lactatiformans TaxID=1550024 RepID=UPI00307B9B6B
MEKYIYDNSNGLWYELLGDYYLPCLFIPEEENHPIGIWGKKHQQYLKEYRPIFYNDLILSGKLYTYLADIDTQARNKLDLLVTQLAEKECISEYLKAQDQLSWVGAMNNVSFREE